MYAGAGNLSDLAVAVPGFSSLFLQNVSVAPAFLPQGTYANTTQSMPQGSEILLVAGLGSMWASAADLIAWYQTLLANPGAVRLQADAVLQMLTPAPLALVAENFYFAQVSTTMPTHFATLCIQIFFPILISEQHIALFGHLSFSCPGTHFSEALLKPEH